jgi:predicted TIM-barrel fold metal-dependent hydrolase
VHAFICGINPNDKNATAHIRRMLDLFPGVFEGIVEIVTRHDGLTSLLPGEPPRSNSEAMMRIYDFAAEHDLPVMLHSNLTSVREREPLYAGEIEQAIAAHPRTRFIWAHAGASTEIHRGQGPMPFLRPTIERLLAEYDNL